MRADKVFMQQLLREPVLQEYLVPSYSPVSDPSPMRRLDRIYIDTSQSWVLSFHALLITTVLTLRICRRR